MTELPNEYALVSVGLPVYNGEATLMRAVKSILSQDYPNIELVISDNGSTDGTFEILEDLASNHANIRIHRSSVNRGWTWNANKVFEQSRGEYFLWAADDDFYDLTFISSAIKQLECYPSAVMCHPKTKATIEGGAEIVWRSSLFTFRGAMNVRQRYKETLRNFPAVAFYGVYRSKLLRNVGTLANIIGSDVVFMQKLSLYGNFIDTDKELFTRVIRTNWNTREENLKSYSGTSANFSRITVRVQSLKQKILDIKETPHSALLKFQLVGLAVHAEIRSAIVKLLCRILIISIPERFTEQAANNLYSKFFKNRNIAPASESLFYSRIILPTLSL